MFPELLKKLADQTIIQSALGSALFFVLLKIVQFIGLQLRRSVGRTGGTFGRKRKLREYIYRRYTSRSGYVNYAYGTMFGLSHAFRGLLAGLIFCSIALLIGGRTPLIWGVCFAAAIFYFGSALTWLIPGSDWSSGDLNEHWKRIAELEKELFGHVEKDTLDYITRFAEPKQGNST